MPTSPSRAVAGLLAVVALASPAAAQPWESTPNIGLRPLTAPSEPPTPSAPVKPAAAKPDVRPAPKPAPKPAATVVAAAQPTPPHPKPTAQPIARPAAAAAPVKPGTPSINMPYPRVVTPATTPAAPSPATAPAGRNAVMIIDAARMADPKTGVRQLVRAFDQLRGEFADRSRKLQDLKAQADNATLALNAATPPTTIAATQSRAQVSQYQTEAAAYQTAFNARLSVLVSPVEAQVHDALSAFATAHGATVVIDRSRFKDSVLMLQPGLDPNSLDMTRAFIDGYNAAHP